MNHPNPLLNLQSYVQSIVEAGDSPAISIAVWYKKSLHQSAAGILNFNTGVTATTDSIFRIGSITKVLTACLVMRLVEDSLLDLDTPVKHYLRNFKLADSQATETVTVRHLLNHTNGIAGDYFPNDIGLQGNWIARYVNGCRKLPQVHPVGEMYSYSNSAYAIVGRVIEEVCNVSWCEAISNCVFKPLGMAHSISTPIDMLFFRTATGYMLNPRNSEEWILPANQYATFGLSPAGTLINTSAADLITFARAHMDGGVSQTGNRWLSEASVRLMQTPHVEKPQLSTNIICSKGLGWDINEHITKNTIIIGHNGLSRGQSALLQIVPKYDMCMAILLNGNRAGVMQRIAHDIMMATVGLDFRDQYGPMRRCDPAKLKDFEGVYYLFGEGYYLVQLQVDKLIVKYTPTGLDSNMPKDVFWLSPIGNNCFSFNTVENVFCTIGCFIRPKGNRKVDYLFIKQRLCKRIP